MAQSGGSVPVSVASCVTTQGNQGKSVRRGSVAFGGVHEVCVVKVGVGVHEVCVVKVVCTSWEVFIVNIAYCLHEVHASSG